MVCADPMAPAVTLPTVTLTDAVLTTHDPVVEVASLLYQVSWVMPDDGV